MAAVYDMSQQLVGVTANATPSHTTETPGKPYPEYVGFICAIIAVVLFGSNFVPVKKYYTGDGE